jgi:hypothetical protein
MNNTMTAIQQNVNNNVNTGLNQMKTEFELMKTHLQRLETQYLNARQTADMLREQQLKNTIDTYAQQMNERADTMALMHRQVLDTEQMALQSLRNPYMEQRTPRRLTNEFDKGKEPVRNEDDDDDEEENTEPITVNIDLLVNQVKELLTRGSRTKDTPIVQSLKGSKLKTGRGFDWKPLKDQLRQIDQRDLIGAFSETKSATEKARKIVALLEKLQHSGAGSSSAPTPPSGASSSSPAPTPPSGASSSSSAPTLPPSASSSSSAPKRKPSK